MYFASPQKAHKGTAFFGIMQICGDFLKDTNVFINKNDCFRWVRIQQFTKKQRPPKKGSLSFCCQTRIRRSDCACCNDCCFATLGNRTSSLSPSKQSLVGTPIRWVLIHEFRNKIRTSTKEILILLPN